jgi:glucoamylase
MVNSATALMAAGDLVTPLRALVYLACSQQPDGGFPQNFWIDGTPYWRAVQLDEVAFPIVLAWRLWKAQALQEFDPYPMVRAAARFLIERGAVTQQERWEEVSGYSPSTIAAAIAALICAADFARSRNEMAEAQLLEDYADFLESHVETWTVTSEGSLVEGISRHYIRILPADVNDPTPAEDPNRGTITLANRPPGEPHQFPAKDIVDAGFLELVRYGVRRAGDPLMEDSLRVIDAVLKVQTPHGPAWRRYNHDGYGPNADGRPYIGFGIGRAWPLLAGERAHYELAAGRDVKPFIATLENFASLSGLLPEQVWDQHDLPAASMILGKSTGSAMPLVWAHAEYIKLLRSVNDGKVFDLIPAVADRYLRGQGRKDWEVWKPNRRVRRIASGSVLRILAPWPFRLRWVLIAGPSSGTSEAAHDGPVQAFRESASTSSNLGLDFIDIPTPPGQAATLRFSFLDGDSSLPKDTEHEVLIGN